jgi:16S rRNA G966 N2-methylase RsmD
MKFQANVPFKLTKMFYEKLGEQPKDKRVLVIRDLFTAMHAAIDNSVTFITDDKEAHELFNKNVASNDEFGNDDTTMLVDTEINKHAWKDFIKEVASMPKFDIAIMNPPYDGNLHLKILKAIIPVADKVVNISPCTWFAKHNRWKPTFTKYNVSIVGKPCNITYIEHREANDVFNLGNQIERLAIMLYDNNNTAKIDLLKEEFTNIEFDIFNKVLSPRTGKLVWRNGINIVEPRNTTLQFTQPVNIWRGGKNCYDAALGTSKNHQQGKIQFQAQFATQQELDNFRSSMKTKFMNWYYYNIVVPADYKLHVSMFVMQDYTQPWDDKRFCAHFGITGYIDDEHAVPNSEWEIILNTIK